MAMKNICTTFIALLLVGGLVPPPAPAQVTAGGKVDLSRPPQQAVPVSPEYRIGLRDKLRVEVYRHEQLSQSLEVRPDGKITLPLIGDVVASGLTPLELRDQLASALAEYVTNPAVTVIVVEANAAVVYVIGEVNQAGSIPMRGPMTVLQALAMAGGFREWASPKNIRILRRNDKSSRIETIWFNYNDAVKGTGTLSYLRPDDMIIVP
jgi:polysaccharide export outer membrane protein